MPTLAASLGLGQIQYKDEGGRFGLGSFKALGGAYAVARVLARELRRQGVANAVSAADLAAGRHREHVARITVTSATDGNHGRSVAWGARLFGCRAVIFIHGTVSEGRRDAIAAYGARADFPVMLFTVAGIVDGKLQQILAHGGRANIVAELGSVDVWLTDVSEDAISVARGNLAGLVFGAAFSSMFFGSILFLTNVWGWSILAAGFGVAPGPALVALLAPRMGAIAGRLGQRPLLITGGLLYAVGGAWRLVLLDDTPSYLADYLPSMLLTGAGVACISPQLSSAVAQSVPMSRIGVGGAVLQAVRQFGGTFGVALTIAFLGRPSDLAAALAGFDRIWLIAVIGGLVTSALSVPLVTRPAAPTP